MRRARVCVCVIPAIPRPRVKSVKYRLFIRALRVLFIRIKFYTGPACSSIETDRVPRGIYVYSQPNVLHTPPPLCFIYHHIYIFTLHYIKKNSGATAASMLSMLMRVAPRATLGQHDEVRARPSRTCRPAGRVSYPQKHRGSLLCSLAHMLRSVRRAWCARCRWNNQSCAAHEEEGKAAETFTLSYLSASRRTRRNSAVPPSPRAPHRFGFGFRIRLGACALARHALRGLATELPRRTLRHA